MKDDFKWLGKWENEFKGKDGKAVLELGCGSGIDSEIISNWSKNLISTDKKSDVIEKNRKDLSDIDFRVLDHSEKLPFKDNSFTSVVASLSLHYFKRSKTVEIFNEIFRVLKPNGLFIGRLNSTRDIHHGSEGNILIEERVLNVSGNPKRFFIREDVEELLHSDWKLISLQEVTIDRYGSLKVVWEFSARRNKKNRILK